MNMTQVAEAAGVSQATVSRVVNGRTFVAEATRQRIFEAIEELGYEVKPPERRPGRMPVPEVLPKSGLVAVLVNRDATLIHSDFVFRLYRNVEFESNRNGLSTMLHFLDPDLALPPLFDRIDAFLVLGSPSDALPNAVWSRPVVWLTSFRRTGETMIITGNDEVGRLAAEFLIGRGHSRLGFFLPEAENPSYQARGKSFRIAASKRGTAVSRFAASRKRREKQKGVSSLEELEERLAPLVDRFLCESIRPTGIFSPSDATTSLLYRHLGRHDIALGKDVEIVSCDNEQSYLAGLTPRPASIDLGIETRAKLAVQNLVEQMEEKQSARGGRLEIDPVLIEGDEVDWTLL